MREQEALPSARSFRRSLFALALALALPSPQASAAASTVREPAYGLPHFYGDTDVALARENGREIAKDRLGQLILLSRVGRGTLFQAFGLLDPGILADDIDARATGYTSSELNSMFENLPPGDRASILAYCAGVNDTIEAIYAGALPEPLEVTLLRTVLRLEDDLFGNATNISDQLDPHYLAPGGADPEHPIAGFQFTPETAMAISVLEVRNFGLGGFDEAARVAELQDLIAARGQTTGTELWEDLNYLNDPLAPISVPDPAAPGFGGPLARKRKNAATRLAAAARKFPRYAYLDSVRRLEERRAARAARATRLGAWPKLGSYAWAIAGDRSATGYPWVGGFPQTGIQTPSIMHFAENRSGEGVQGIGMEFAGGPFILIGQTDSVAWTTTTAQLPVVDTFFETLVSENTDALRYLDEGTPAPLAQRTEIFLGLPASTRIFWRSHERNGNGGTRPIVDFLGDAAGTAEAAVPPAPPAPPNTLTDTGAFASLVLAGGAVAITGGTGAGQMRLIASHDADTLTLQSDWTTPPDDTSEYVAVGAGSSIVAVAPDSAVWLEESTAVLGFSRYQRANSVLDVRAGTRLIPSTHNFLAADNRLFNGTGTASTNGNIGYWSSGFSRVRQDATDPRLPLDGVGPNPLVLLSGAVASATDTTLTAADPTAFQARDLSPPPLNFRYDDPSRLGSEYVVTITGGAGAKQTRRIASNTNATLTIEFPWGAIPDATSSFEVYEILAMPEAINPAEGYTANWNNKAATRDPGSGFGRQHRVIFILERLAANSSWDRAAQRQLNEDVAGLDGKGAFGRFLVPRLREAVDLASPPVDPQVAAVLGQLEAHAGSPLFGRNFVDPVLDTTMAGELAFLEGLVSELANLIYGDDYAGAVSVPGGSRGLALVQHAIDSAAGGPLGAYAQVFSGDYFGASWDQVVRDGLATRAAGGIPADSVRAMRLYVHPLDAAVVSGGLAFEPTPRGNRGVWEQIVEVGPVVRGEFIFPLGQSGLIEGDITAVSAIDPNVDSLQPIWRDWRFVPMLAVSADLATTADGDGDADGVLDGFERWYFGSTAPGPTDDGDADNLSLVEEFLAGSDPTSDDTDGDGVIDGDDFAPQDRLVVPEPSAVLLRVAALASLALLARRRRR